MDDLPDWISRIMATPIPPDGLSAADEALKRIEGRADIPLEKWAEELGAEFAKFGD